MSRTDSRVAFREDPHSSSGLASSSTEALGTMLRVSVRCREFIIMHDKFKICREFIIMINSDVFKNLLIYSKFKGGAHAGFNVHQSVCMVTYF